jgi:hypothetical protein
VNRETVSFDLLLAKQDQHLAALLARVSPEPNSGCWLWVGNALPSGYGLFRLRDNGRIARMTAHRASYVLHFGAFPRNLFVCHRCDNPPCVNPDHLFLGSAADNAHDRNTKGRSVGQGKGEAHSLAKITEEQARRIIALVAPGQMTAREIARDVGTTSTTVYAISVGATWKHLPRPPFSLMVRSRGSNFKARTAKGALSCSSM